MAQIKFRSQNLGISSLFTTSNGRGRTNQSSQQSCEETCMTNFEQCSLPRETCYEQSNLCLIQCARVSQPPAPPKLTPQQIAYNECAQTCSGSFQGGDTWAYNYPLQASPCQCWFDSPEYKNCSTTCANNGGVYQQPSRPGDSCVCWTTNVNDLCNLPEQCGGGNLWGWPTKDACIAKCKSVHAGHFE